MGLFYFRFEANIADGQIADADKNNGSLYV